MMRPHVWQLATSGSDHRNLIERNAENLSGVNGARP